jgi:L-rhamnose isomerase/sugar isomerase
MEAMVQTVMTAQELFAKAALVDQAGLRLQQECRLVKAEGASRVRSGRMCGRWCGSGGWLGAAGGPLKARESGYVEKIAGARGKSRSVSVMRSS